MVDIDPETRRRLMSYYASQRPRETATCDRCGGTYTRLVRRADAPNAGRYCSPACRVAAYRDRAQDRATRRPLGPQAAQRAASPAPEGGWPA